MTEPFGRRLRAAMDARGALCVGIDPHPSLLAGWGLPDDAGGLERFCRTAVDAIADRVAVVKPQSAFFERHGARGIAVLERVVADARAAGALVILDVKRGDIGSTVQAYADAYLDPRSPLCADAVTASPYLGVGALRPLLDTALAYDNGVFVLAMTSNPEGPLVQRARTADGRTVAGAVLDAVRELNGPASPGLGSVGAVIGATIADTDEDLDVGGPLLVPGLGAQGGAAGDLRRLFGAVLAAVLPATSREVLSAGPEMPALRAAVARAASAYTAALAT